MKLLRRTAFSAWVFYFVLYACADATQTCIRESYLRLTGTDVDKGRSVNQILSEEVKRTTISAYESGQPLPNHMILDFKSGSESTYNRIFRIELERRFALEVDSGFYDNAKLPRPRTWEKSVTEIVNSLLRGQKGHRRTKEKEDKHSVRPFHLIFFIIYLLMRYHSCIVEGN